MQRSIARRFAPLAALAAVQLLIIAVAPSKAPDSGVGAFAGVGSDVVGSEVIPSGTSGGATGAGSGATTGGTTGAGGAGASGATGSSGAGGGGGGGDTSHCVGDRQYDPAIEYYAPPCVPRWSGDNGGATYQGVTADTITIVDYAGKGSEAVDTILRAQGAYVELAQRRAYNEAVMKFINDNYELYGRKLEIKIVEGNCNSIPPDNACLRSEMRQIAADHKPLWFKWNSSLSSETYDELSRLGIFNSGGWHFRDSFGESHAPFHFDVQMSGTDLARHAGQWWCQQMASHPTEYAGTANPAENLNGRPRLLGVISTNDPENQAAIEVDLKNELAKCGQSYGGRFYFYAQDITTADQQRRAAVLKMRSDGVATSIMCFCDLVAPMFLYAEEQQQNYYPENIIVGSGFMDSDAASQAYMGAVGCPIRARPCNFEDAFGLSSINAQEPEFQDRGSRVWQAGGGQGNPPYSSVTADWDYWNMIASILQMAGPNITPQTVAEGAARLGCRGGGDTGYMLRCLEPGSYSWNQDMRPVYWSTQTPSPYNGEDGSYVELGPRIRVGEYRPEKWTMPGKPR
ncbi:MAG TPA: hypothetical protein VM262_00160 [Acidimicrobiales bacterium]|nr:hypothetical protein [Acidimicrobiales bacterium]